MPRFRLTLEHSLYLAFAAVALFLRLYQLGAYPLNDAEAHDAWVAYRLVQGAVSDNPLLPHSPAYVAGAYLSFLLFGASDAVARLIPTLAGVALVLAPFGFRDALGRGGALATSAMLAVSAVGVAVSRTADGALLAVAGLAWAIGAWRLYRETRATGWLMLSAASLGVGLATGAAFVLGALTLGLTLVLWRFLSADAQGDFQDLRQAIPPAQRQTYLITTGLVLAAVASVGTLYLAGLGAWMTSLLGGFGAWLAPATAAARGTWLAGLIVYEPLAVVGGVLGAAWAWTEQHRLGRALSLWAACLWFVTLLGGQLTLAEALWLSVPLASLAGYGLARTAQAVWATREDWPVVSAHLGLALVLMSFVGIQLAMFGEQVRISAPIAAGFYLSVAVIFLVLLLGITYLIALGWSDRAALTGLFISVTFALACGSVGASWSLAHQPEHRAAELWWSAQQPLSAADVTRMVTTLHTTSNYAVGHEAEIEVTVQGDANGALGWALRNFKYAQFVTAVDASVASPAVIAPADLNNPTLGSAYIGQSFVVAEWPDTNFNWTRALGWWVFRRAPVNRTHFILWVRQDVQQLNTVGQ